MNRFLRIFLWTIIPLFVVFNIITAFHAYKFTHFYNRIANDTTHVKKDVSVNDIFFGINYFKKPDSTVPDTSYETVYLTTEGLKLEGWMVKARDPKGTIAMFHGHGGNKSDILLEAQQFRRLGYNTFLLDFRAHGNSDGNTCTIGVKEADDVQLVYNYLKGIGEQHIILWGVSLGAASITRAVSIHHIKPDKIILELPFGSLLQAVEGRVKMMHLPAQPISSMLTFWGGVEHGFWAFSNRPSEYVKDIKCPVLLQFGELDNRVSREEDNDISKNIFAPKTVVMYSGAKHESLCKKDPEKWLTIISSFLRS